MIPHTRRNFLRSLGLGPAVLPFLPPLRLLRATEPSTPPKRVVFVFSPNGTVPPDFWPDAGGTDFSNKRILEPLKPFWDRMLTLNGICNKVRGDGDGHMRGMSCLLTAIELFPGNIQGGGETPAGWASGPSIDQELKKHYQSKPETTTRFGSLEFGVAVPNRADPWTRWIYAGANQPVAPVSDPYLSFEKLYGSIKDRENLASVLDDVSQDLTKVTAQATPEEKALLEKHVTLVREMEKDLQGAQAQKLKYAPPQQEAGVDDGNDGMPKATAMQIDLLVSALANDLTRVASLQFTASVGQARMHWLGINENHHALSHDPDLNKDSQEKLVKINIWFAEQLALLTRKLAETPEPGGSGTLLDNTTVIWTNELGKGNSHSHDNIPFLILGGGTGWKMGRALQFDKASHNRLWLALAHSCGYPLSTFGKKSLCEGGLLVI